MAEAYAEIERLEARIKEIKNGFEGCCTACEPVAEQNNVLRSKNELLEKHAKHMKVADAIVSSEQFMWLMAGSNHQESQLAGLRPAYQYWKEQGGVGILKQSVEALNELARLDEELGLI